MTQEPDNPATRHADDHEERLAEYLSGSLDEASAEELRSCPMCDEKIKQLGGIASELAAAAGHQREVMAEVEAAPANEVEERRIAELARRGRSSDGASRRGWIAAAAVLLLASLALWKIQPRERVMLGDGPIELVSPVEEVDDFGIFAWTSDFELGTEYHVVVTSDDGEPLPGGEVRTEETTWSPETEGWPDTIRWSVTAYDFNNEVQGTESARAWR